jgi:hypothetical protein
MFQQSLRFWFCTPGGDCLMTSTKSYSPNTEQERSDCFQPAQSLSHVPAVAALLVLYPRRRLSYDLDEELFAEYGTGAQRLLSTRSSRYLMFQQSLRSWFCTPGGDCLMTSTKNYSPNTEQERSDCFQHAQSISHSTLCYS